MRLTFRSYRERMHHLVAGFRLMRGSCGYCGKYDLQDNAGDYYHQKACEESFLLRELQHQDHSPEQRAELVRRLDLARYVGD